MRTVYAQKNKKIILGRQGEDKAVRVVWTGIVSDWSSLYGDGYFQLSVRRFGDENAYPVVVEVNGDDIRFTVTSAETAIAGNGKCELTYIANGTIAKSATWETVVLNSLTGQTPSEPPEEPAKSWFTSIQGQIGNLADLATASKDNLVSAINEAAQSGGGGGASVELDTTLSKAGKAADAKAVGDALAEKQPKGDYLTQNELPDMTAYRTAEAQDAIDANKQNTLIQSGAAVGQIAKITAVDDNGKPTAWQAVDMPRGGGDVWEFGGTIPLDLTTPTAIYEFAPCSIWKKVRIVRVRSSYNADLISNVWYGASNCKNYGGSIGKQNLLYTSNGYVYHYIEMMSDDDGGIIGTCASSNNANILIKLEISSYSNNRVTSNIPATYGARSLTKDSNWVFQAVDPSAAWDGNETYYWWGVRA